MRLHAERLQINAVPEATDQHIGTEAKTDSSFSTHAGVAATQRARPHFTGCKYRPGQNCLPSDTNINAKFANSAAVTLDTAVVAFEDAPCCFG